MPAAGPGGSGGSVSRFAVVFDVEGNWEEAFSMAGDAFDRLGGVADGAAKRVTDAAQSVDAFANGMRRIQQMGAGMQAFGTNILGAFAGLTTSGIQTIMPLETMMQRIKAIAKTTDEEARDIIENAFVMAEKTPFIARDVAMLAQSLAIAKVDLRAFKDEVTGADLTVAAAHKKGWANALGQDALQLAGDMKVSATTLLADLAAMSGVGPERMNKFVYGMQRALLTGQSRILFDDIPRHFIDAIWKIEGQEAKATAQQAMQNIFKLVSKEGQIGAAAAASSTMGTLLQNFEELGPKMYRALFGMPDTGGMFDRFKGVIKDMYMIIAGVINDPAFIGSIQGALIPILEMINDFAIAMTKVTKKVFEFIRDNPKLIKFLTITTAIIGALATAAGTLIVLAAGFGILAASIAAAVLGWAAVAPFAATLGTIAAAATGVVAGFTAMGAIVSELYNSYFPGFREAVDSVWYVIKGVTEGIMNMTSKTTTMSDETAQGLAELGLLEFVGDLLSYANRIYNFFRSIGLGFQMGMESMAPSFETIKAAFGFLLDSALEIARALGLMAQETVEGGAEFQEFSSIGMAIGGVLAAVVAAIEWVIIGVLGLTSAILQGAAWLIKWRGLFSLLFIPIYKVWNAIQSVIKVFGHLTAGEWGEAFKEMGLAVIDWVLTPIQLLIKTLVTLAKLAGKEEWIPQFAIDFADKGIRGLFEGKKDWTIKGFGAADKEGKETAPTAWNMEQDVVDWVRTTGAPEAVNEGLSTAAKFYAQEGSPELVRKGAEVVASVLPSTTPGPIVVEPNYSAAMSMAPERPATAPTAGEVGGQVVASILPATPPPVAATEAAPATPPAEAQPLASVSPIRPAEQQFMTSPGVSSQTIQNIQNVTTQKPAPAPVIPAPVVNNHVHMSIDGQELAGVVEAYHESELERAGGA